MTPMTEGIESVTRSALALALDAASLRQQAIATNIAHAHAVGYVPQRVSFEDQLRDARQDLAQAGRLDARALDRIRPRIEAAGNGLGASGSVRLDVEAVEMARNATQYQALLKGLSRHFSILAMAAGDGRK